MRNPKFHLRNPRLGLLTHAPSSATWLPRRHGTQLGEVRVPSDRSIGESPSCSSHRPTRCRCPGRRTRTSPQARRSKCLVRGAEPPLRTGSAIGKRERRIDVCHFVGRSAGGWCRGLSERIDGARGQAKLRPSCRDAAVGFGHRPCRAAAVNRRHLDAQLFAVVARYRGSRNSPTDGRQRCDNVDSPDPAAEVAGWQATCRRSQ
jgi:hypothetical protein